MADIKIKHLLKKDDKPMEVGHLYQSLCGDMARHEGEPKEDGSEAACIRCVNELMAKSNEMLAELETYHLMFFPAAIDGADN